MSDKRIEKVSSTPSSDAIAGQPDTAFELVNKYGTYNIQPTADTRNTFPAISHGLSEQHAQENERRRDEWIKSQRKKSDPAADPKP